MKFFKKLCKALEVVQENEKIFAIQIHPRGAQNFLTIDNLEVWPWYSNLKPKDKNVYEVIRQNKPCRGYWDIEYDKTENPDKEGDEAVDKLIEKIIDEIDQKFKIILNKSDFLILSSHSDQKFSVHLILTPLGVKFNCNRDVGIFTKTIQENLSTQLDKLLSIRRKGKQEKMIDSCVYSKNRCFRLYLSSKLGNYRPLILGERDIHHLEGAEKCDPAGVQTLDKFIFEESLVEQSGVGLEMEVFKFNNMETKTALQQRCEIKVQSKSPMLDDFILNIAQTNKITKILYYKSGVLVYNFKEKINCNNIRGFHSSNNSYFVVNLNTRIAYSKCHSQRCKHFKSKNITIPPHVKINPENV